MTKYQLVKVTAARLWLVILGVLAISLLPEFLAASGVRLDWLWTRIR